MSNKLLSLVVLAVFSVSTYAAEDVVIEAETATLTPSMKAVDDAKASGGKYITAESTKGKAVTEFDIAEDGDYEIWIKATGPNGNSDSFFFVFDDGEKMTIDLMGKTDFKWQEAKDRTSKSHVVKLTKGKHKLTILPREAGAMLDVVVIAKPGFKPEK